MHVKAQCDARRALTWYGVIPVKGGNNRESIPGISRFRAEEPEGESCEFDRLGGVWWTNMLRIRNRLVILSNFHVQRFSTRATVYFLLIIKVLNHFLNYYLFKSNIIQNSV